MAGDREGMKIVLQVGAELRIRNNGDVTMDNPELELAADDRAADAVLLYRFDEDTREHVLRLVEPVADHKHVKVHRANDWKLSQLVSTFFLRSASYLWGRSSSGNVQDFAFDRVSAAWDNLSFWGYDEPSTDYSLRIIDRSLWRGRCGASAARAADRAEIGPFPKRLRARRCLLQFHDGPHLRAAV